jgi:hypothetical protein
MSSRSFFEGTPNVSFAHSCDRGDRCPRRQRRRTDAKDQRDLHGELDVLARWALDNFEAAKKLVLIRTLACEGNGCRGSSATISFA